MYGSRLRIGLIVPSSNSTIEPEFVRMAPADVAIYSTRVFQQETDRAEEKVATVLAMNRLVDSAAEVISSVLPNVIAYGCTAASFLDGPVQDRLMTERLTQRTGIKVITTSSAVATALKAIGARRIALGTPYIDEVNNREITYLEQAIGVEIVAVKGLQIVGNLPKGRLPASAAEAVARSVDRSDADAIFLSCTNWRTIDLIEALEKDLGKVVITSNQATFWACLASASIRENLGRWGRLFSYDLPRTASAIPRDRAK